MSDKLDKIKKLEDLKEEYGEVFESTVSDKDGLISGFFHKPTFDEFSKIYPLIQRGDDLNADKRLIEACFIEGDNKIIDIKNNLDIFLSIKGKIGQLIEMRAVTLKKK